MGSVLHQYDHLFNRCSELKKNFAILQQRAEVSTVPLFLLQWGSECGCLHVTNCRGESSFKANPVER